MLSKEQIEKIDAFYHALEVYVTAKVEEIVAINTADPNDSCAGLGNYKYRRECEKTLKSSIRDLFD